MISDEKLGRQVGETIEDVSNYAQRLTGLKLEINIHSDYLINAGAARLKATLKIVVRPDKYYLLSLDQRPSRCGDRQLLQTNPPSQGDPALQKITTTNVNALKFSAQFAKRYYWAAFRFGIIESSGGVGVDLFFFKDQLSLQHRHLRLRQPPAAVAPHPHHLVVLLPEPFLRGRRRGRLPEQPRLQPARQPDPRRAGRLRGRRHLLHRRRPEGHHPGGPASAVSVSPRGATGSELPNAVR